MVVTLAGPAWIDRPNTWITVQTLVGREHAGLWERNDDEGFDGDSPDPGARHGRPVSERSALRRAGQGDFATAGAANINSANRLQTQTPGYAGVTRAHCVQGYSSSPCVSELRVSVLNVSAISVDTALRR